MNKKKVKQKLKRLDMRTSFMQDDIEYLRNHRHWAKSVFQRLNYQRILAVLFIAAGTIASLIIIYEKL